MATKDLDLTTLRLFVAVCDARNIAHAAEREHLVGSAVSKRMAQLELQMGTPLLVRKRHGVAPGSSSPGGRRNSMRSICSRSIHRVRRTRHSGDQAKMTLLSSTRLVSCCHNTRSARRLTWSVMPVL